MIGEPENSADSLVKFAVWMATFPIATWDQKCERITHVRAAVDSNGVPVLLGTVNATSFQSRH
jgi:hypothetical protein